MQLSCSADEKCGKIVDSLAWKMRMRKSENRLPLDPSGSLNHCQLIRPSTYLHPCLLCSVDLSVMSGCQLELGYLGVGPWGNAWEQRRTRSKDDPINQAWGQKTMRMNCYLPIATMTTRCRLG